MEKKKNYIFVIFVIGLIVIDQILKLIATYQQGTLLPGVLNITLVENRGGAFGVGQNSTMTFILTNIVVIGIILRFLIIQKDELEKRTVYSLLLIMAGGIGNLIDRVVRGYVVDFIDITPIFPFPKFNIADCYITVGIVLLLVFLGISTYQKKKQNKNKGKKK